MNLIKVNFTPKKVTEAFVTKYSALEVANAFLLSDRSLTPMKIQKLLYFAHGWCLALTGQELIQEQFEASEYGPVIPTVYNTFKKFGSGKIIISNEENKLSEKSIKLVDAILKKYGCFDSMELSDLTHQKDSPWYFSFQKGKNKKIPNDQIEKYFKTLRKNG